MNSIPHKKQVSLRCLFDECYRHARIGTREDIAMQLFPPEIVSASYRCYRQRERPLYISEQFRWHVVGSYAAIMHYAPAASKLIMNTKMKRGSHNWRMLCYYAKSITPAIWGRESID